MVKPKDTYKKVEDNWVSRFILDEVVIMPLCRSEEDMQYIYSISNETGSRIWQLLDGRHSVGDIQEILKSEYQAQREVVEREVLEFIGDLLEVKLIQKVNLGAKRKDQYRASSIQQHPDKRKNYKSPEIVKVKMQPEQAVLACCAAFDPYTVHKSPDGYPQYAYCYQPDMLECLGTGCNQVGSSSYTGTSQT